MRKLLFILFIFTLLSCNDKSNETRVIEFHNMRIKIPSSLTQKTLDSCSNVQSYTDLENKSSLEFKICNYGLITGRQSFESLNKFFQEECEVLKHEILNSNSLKKLSKKIGDNYIFRHDFRIGEKYFSNNYIAYKNNYLTITLQTLNKKTLAEFKKTIETLSYENLSSKINTSGIDKCYYCKRPLFW
ncbi:hypothetical protein ACSIGC_09270 [Tenacibaculum sp. ZS6-P6]|uniref:hypothetical protein n=1 Tax=Tenacibaculum sp. ZS6-P6 TaxID=3447503 RepID=UPI003F95E096